MFPASLLFSVLSTHGSQALSAWEPSLPACPLPPAPDPARPRGPDARLLSQAVLQVLSPEDAAPEVPARAFRHSKEYGYLEVYYSGAKVNNYQILARS